jgi:hypothetical protein
MRNSLFLVCLFIFSGQINIIFADEVTDVTAKVAMVVRPGEGIGDFSIGSLPPLEVDSNTIFLIKKGVIDTIISKDPLCFYRGEKVIGESFASIKADYDDLLPVEDNDKKLKEEMYVLEEGLFICIVNGHVDHILVYKESK